MKRGLERLAQIEANQKSLLKKKRPEEEELPNIVNFVATTPILPQTGEYSLCLGTISNKWGCSQYAPNLFAANIIKTRDAVSTSTVLLFVSGIMVVVSGQSMNHARNVSQAVRLNIERTHCMMHRINPIDGSVEIYKGSLKGRTTCSECSIHNIVGHGSVGFKLNLQKLVDTATNCWKWIPDLFPGAKGKIWLTESIRCECDAGAPGVIPSKRVKCKCNIKVIVFDSGQVVITGGRTIEEVNAGFRRIRKLAPSFESSNQTDVPRDERFYKRLADMMVPTGETMKNAETVQRKEMNEEEVLACVLSGITIAPSMMKEPSRKIEEGTTPLMRMAESGNIEGIEMLLLMDPDQIEKKDANGLDAIQRLQKLSPRSKNTEQILKILLGIRGGGKC